MPRHRPHCSFQNNIIIRVKVLCRIILMMLLIGIIGYWCFCGTWRGCLLLRNLLTNLQNPFNKWVKSFFINISVNACLGNFCRSNIQEYKQNSIISLTAHTCFHLIHDTHSVLLWILRTFTEMERTTRQLEVLVSGCWFRSLAVYQELEKLFAQYLMNFLPHVMDPWVHDEGNLILKHGLFSKTNRESLHILYCCPLFFCDVLGVFHKFLVLFKIFCLIVEAL